MNTPKRRGSPQIQSCRVLVVSDRPLVRLALRAILHEDKAFEYSGEAASTDQAVYMVRGLDPDMAILELSFKGRIGFKAIREMKGQSGRLRVLAISSRDDAYFADHALAAGAMGYLSNQAPPAQFHAAMDCLRRGTVYLPSELSQQLLFRVVEGYDGPPTDPVSGLTPRELDVFLSIGRGQTVKQIARQLGLSVHTIATYRERIRRKIGAHDAAELTFRAIVWLLMND